MNLEREISDGRNSVLEILERETEGDLLILEDGVGEEELTDRESLRGKKRKSAESSRAQGRRERKTYLLVLLEDSIGLALRCSVRVLNLKHPVDVARESARKGRRVEQTRI